MDDNLGPPPPRPPHFWIRDWRSFHRLVLLRLVLFYLRLEGFPESVPTEYSPSFGIIPAFANTSGRRDDSMHQLEKMVFSTPASTSLGCQRQTGTGSTQNVVHAPPVAKRVQVEPAGAAGVSVTGHFFKNWRGKRDGLRE